MKDMTIMITSITTYMSIIMMNIANIIIVNAKSITTMIMNTIIKKKPFTILK